MEDIQQNNLDKEETQQDNIDKNDENFKCRLEYFEGPIDLLLYLIKKNEIDINNIPLESITSQYLDYLEKMREHNVDIASEFIVTAATLLHFKTRWLLPVENNDEDETETDDPVVDFLQKLLEYKKFKEAGEYFEDRLEKETTTFPRGIMPIEEDEKETIVSNGIFDLCHAFQEILKKKDTIKSSEVHRDTYTVSEKMTHIKEALFKLPGKKVSFTTLLEEIDNKDEIVCTFLAILEMVKNSEIAVEQDSRIFGEIFICLKENKNDEKDLINDRPA